MQQAYEQRNQYFDFIRGIGCYLVFFAHVCILHLDFVMNSVFLHTIFNAIVYAIPIFIIISGKLMLRRAYSYREISKKIMHFIALIAFWNFLYAIVVYWQQGILTILQMTLLQMIKDVWQGSYYYQFWFLYLLMFLYSITPLLYRLYTTHKKRYLQVVMWLGLLCILVDSINLGCEIQGYACIMRIPQILRMWIWLFYFMLGGCLSDVCQRMERCMIVTKSKVLLSVFITLFLLLIASERIDTCMPEMFYGSILVICSLCLCFTYRQQAALQLHRSLHIATYFIGIYILQLPLLTMTSPLFQFILQWPFSTIWYFLFSNFVFVVLVVVCKVLYKNKYLRETLR